jgi:hypothetical protein
VQSASRSVIAAPRSRLGDGLEGEVALRLEPFAGRPVVDHVGADDDVAAVLRVEVEAGPGEAVVVGDLAAGGEDPGEAAAGAGLDGACGARLACSHSLSGPVALASVCVQLLVVP